MFVCKLCNFRTKHSSSMVKHLRNEHKYTYERIREEWKNVVEERNVMVVKDGIDLFLENVKRL